MNTPPLAHKVIIPRPYVPEVATDIRITFARIRAEMVQQAARHPK